MKGHKNPKVLKRLYWEENFSLARIAKRFNVSQDAIGYWMKKYKIPRRHNNMRRQDISKELLQMLYLKKRLSMPKIAKILNTTYNTIWNKMKKYGIKARSMSEAKMKYPKFPFSGNLVEKAYMLGLRAGDISATRACKQITVTTASTHHAQLEMFRKVFEKYSYVHSYIATIKDGRRAWRIYCRLDKSFIFLLNKPNKIPKWILEKVDFFYAFLAGYSDCEACWYLYKQKDSKNLKLRFQIASGDEIILKQIRDKLIELGFRPRFRLVYKKGYKSTFGKSNTNMYCLNLNFQKDVQKLAKILLCFSLHQEKIWKMKFILENIGKSWSDVCNRLEEFKELIDKTNLNKFSKEGLQSRHYATKF